MKKITRALTLFLASAMLIAMLAACKEENEGPADTTTGNQEGNTTTTDAVTNELYELPEENLDGYELNIFTLMGPVTTWLTFPYFDTEDTTTKISSAIYNRNALIEEKLSCKIIETNADNTNSEMWVSLLASDEDVYQCGTDYSWNSITRATENYLVDLSKVDTIKLEKPWWDQNLNKAYSLNGHTFVASGSAMTSSWDEIFVMYFNSKVLNSLDANMNLYKEVEDGKWTLDRFCELVIASDNAINDPSSEVEKYGFATQSFYSVSSFMGGNNVTYAKLDNDGKAYNYSLEERFINTLQTLAEKLPASDSIYYGDSEIDEMFMNEEAVFLNNCIGCMSKMRNLSAFDYGVLPMPKYDETVDKYYSFSGAQYLLFIPYTNGNVDKTGTILEAMMGLSDKTLKQFYIEEMLGVIYSRTPETSVMLLEYILPNTLYDFGGRSGLQFNNLIPVAQMIPLGMTDIMSAVSAVTEDIKQKLDTVNRFEG